MADLLGSILGQMEKPPTLGEADKKKAKEEKEKIEKLQKQERERLKQFRLKSQKAINDFIKDSNGEKYKFKPMDKVYRAILHEVADVAGLTSFSFGEDEVDRHIMVWKKEFAPTDNELAAYRHGEDWNPEKAAQLARQKELQEAEAEAPSVKPEEITPQTDYKEKYERLIGKDSAKDAAKLTLANKAYGFVTSENKRDRRTIEEVLAETQAKKKLRATGTDEKEENSSTVGNDSETTLSNHDR